MNIILILSALILILLAVIYALIRKILSQKEDLSDEKERADRYKKKLALTTEMQKKAAAIDSDIERKKNERKKLSKSDKINAANSRR